ncbi:MAG TPA: hypothetical protein VHM88_16510 [Candidatus Acidoferrales bacterium]|jgi:hypothetical protein|nr:hypothetical protein [Candidatus Acidoferrales bacterium]
MALPRLGPWGTLIAIAVLFGCPSLRAQSQIAGTYRCTTIRVGKSSAPCSSPPLTLFADGSYQIWSEQGTYTISGKNVVLSESKKRGPGRLRSGNTIVFQYYYRGRKHVVTFQRHESLPPGSAII